MAEPRSWDRFPRWSPAVANLPALLVAGIGAYLLARITVWLVIPYLAYMTWVEMRILWSSCRECVYYGGGCAFGKGRIAALFLKQGDPHRFANRQIRWIHLLPDFVLFPLPVAAGVALLSRQFSWTTLILTVVLAVVSLAGTALVRGSLACRYCKQRTIGCPAERLFSGKSGS